MKEYYILLTLGGYRAVRTIGKLTPKEAQEDECGRVIDNISEMNLENMSYKIALSKCPSALINKTIDYFHYLDR